MVFGLLTDIIETGLDVVEGLCYGELPTKRQVAELVDAGMTIYTISEVTGFSQDVIQDLLDD